MARKIRSFQESYDILKPYIENYVECVRKAFADFIQINQFKNTLDVYTEFEIRTRANIIHDFVCARLAQTFGSTPEIEVGKWNQVFALKFGELLFLRNKKFKKEGSVSNYATPSHKSFLKQGVIEGMPDEPTFIIGGYVPNHTYTELKGIYLGCWSADGLEWFNKVGEYVVEQGRIVFPEFIEEPVTKKRTKVKGKAKDDEQRKTGND
jgi:hypothetical protein